MRIGESGDIVIYHDEGCRPSEDPREPCDCDARIIEFTNEPTSGFVVSPSGSMGTRTITRRKGHSGANVAEIIDGDADHRRHREIDQRRSREWELILNSEAGSDERRDINIRLMANTFDGQLTTEHARAVSALMYRYGWRYDPSYGTCGEIAVNCGDPGFELLEEQGWPLRMLEEYLICFTLHQDPRCFTLHQDPRPTVCGFCRMSKHRHDEENANWNPEHAF